MSHSGDRRPKWASMGHKRATTSPPSSREMSVADLADEFRDVLSNDKRDSVNLSSDSPVSTLQIAMAATSSSGSSSAPLMRKTSGGNSGELSAGSSGSSGGAGGGGSSPTSESARNSSRCVRTGNVLGVSSASKNLHESVGPGRSAGPSATGLLVQAGSPVRSISPVASVKGSGRSDVLGSGSGNYGHGSVMRGGGRHGECPPPPIPTGNIRVAGESLMLQRAIKNGDPEEVKKAGNEHYKKGRFADALRLYERAIEISPENATCRSNRAAALTALGRLTEAVRECEEAIRIDPNYERAHHRLVGLHLRLGQVENARRHLRFSAHPPDSIELQKLETVERHLSRCADARKVGDWKSVLQEADAVIAAGADSSLQIFASRAESLLKLHRLDEANSALSNVPKIEAAPSSCSQAKFFGMSGDSYLLFVYAQVEMSLGRFESAISSAEKAWQLDAQSHEISLILSKVRAVARARTRGNDLFNSGKYAEASSAYGEGLEYDPCNPVLYCNRAACRSKLGQWERSIDDCNQALRIQPNYIKALLRRAASNSRLERWSEAVHDYEILKKQLPADSEVAETLHYAQIALKKSRDVVVDDTNFCGDEVEEIFDTDQLKAVISSPGVSVVHFKDRSNQQCKQISSFVRTLCPRYPSVNFLTVDVDDRPAVARSENVRIVPTFKIYKNGNKLKEMVCPSQQILEFSVRNYSL